MEKERQGLAFCFGFYSQLQNFSLTLSQVINIMRETWDLGGNSMSLCMQTCLMVWQVQELSSERLAG